MDPVTIFLVGIAGLFLLGALGEIIFAKTQIPDVVWLIAAGVVLGPVTGLIAQESLTSVTPYFAALTLIIVLFEGGSRLALGDLVRAAPRASLLALMSFVVTVAILTGLSLVLAHFGVLERWSVAHGVMFGAILGGSSSLIIMPSMAVAKVDDDVANLVGLESALTDALCVVVTMAMIEIVLAGSTTASDAALTLGKSFGIALGIGILAGWVWMPVLRLLANNPHAYPLTLAALILLYVLVDFAGGSAAMGILAFAVMLGNADVILKGVGMAREGTTIALDPSVRTTHAQISFIIKSFFFTFIGLMIGPPWEAVGYGVLIGLVLLVARLPAVQVALVGSGLSPQKRRMVMVALPRGMAAGVLATMPMHAGVPGTDELPTLVFSAVVTSIVVFAIGFPWARSGSTPNTDARPSSDKPGESGTEVAVAPGKTSSDEISSETVSSGEATLGEAAPGEAGLLRETTTPR